VSVHTLGQDVAAETRSRFEQNHIQGGIQPRECFGGGETGDAAADDHDAPLARW
jgi:hypothetical protein